MRHARARPGETGPSDIDNYFTDEDAHHWGRITVANIATILRIFLRYGASQGWCKPLLAETIRSPHIYGQETLPYAPGWDDVQRVLAAPPLTCSGQRKSEVFRGALEQWIRIQHLEKPVA